MIQLQYIKHNDIDLKKWDNAILSSQVPFVFAQSFYLNATCPQWDALVIGDYESVFPVTHKVKFGFHYLPQPPFTSQLGAYGKLSDEVENVFYAYIVKHFSLIEIELNVANKIKSEFISPKNTFTLNYTNHVKFNQNTKRNIGKANENGFTVEQVDEKESFVLSQKYLNPFLSGTLGLSKSSLEAYERLIHNSAEKGYLYSFKVIDLKNEMKAFAHFISNGKHALFLKGTNFDRTENSGSMHLLMQHAIDFFRDKATFFDFGGGSNSKGLADFYKGFGGEIMEYGFLRVNRLPWLIKLIKNKK
jgi:hypothetical protein